MPSLFPESDPIARALFPLETGGFVAFRLAGQTIAFDRLDRSGAAIVSDVQVSTTPEGRSTKSIGAVSFQDGSVGVWWVQHDQALDNDRLLFKQVRPDGTLGPTPVAATANTAAHVLYDNIHATILTNGQVALSADGVGPSDSSGSITYSTFVSRITPGQAAGADLSTVVSRGTNLTLTHQTGPR